MTLQEKKKLHTNISDEPRYKSPQQNVSKNSQQAVLLASTN